MRNLFVLSAPALETENRVFLSNQIFQENNSLNPALLNFMGTKNIFLKDHYNPLKNNEILSEKQSIASKLSHDLEQPVMSTVEEERETIIQLRSRTRTRKRQRSPSRRS